MPLLTFYSSLKVCQQKINIEDFYGVWVKMEHLKEKGRNRLRFHNQASEIIALNQLMDHGPQLEKSLTVIRIPVIPIHRLPNKNQCYSNYFQEQNA